MKLLLHCCCAPCSIQCVSSLGKENIIPELFWYNPNIEVSTEHLQRRQTLVTFAEENNLGLIESSIRNPLGLNGAKGVRCNICYEERLKETIMTAKERGFDAFSTTLLISPYQDHDLIRVTAEHFAKKYDIVFYYKDFRDFFWEGQREARAKNYYMQKYCGRRASFRERYGEGIELKK